MPLRSDSGSSESVGFRLINRVHPGVGLEGARIFRGLECDVSPRRKHGPFFGQCGNDDTLIDGFPPDLKPFPGRGRALPRAPWDRIDGALCGNYGGSRRRKGSARFRKSSRRVSRNGLGIRKLCVTECKRIASSGYRIHSLFNLKSERFLHCLDLVCN